MKDLDSLLERLAKSNFRNSFHLKDKDREYILEKGIDEIMDHAYNFVDTRLGLLKENDGKQTPMRGHPVFIAQHATATCCRGCIEKWHHIKKDKELSEDEKEYLVDVIIKWIEKETNNKC